MGKILACSYIYLPSIRGLTSVPNARQCASNCIFDWRDKDCHACSGDCDESAIQRFIGGNRKAANVAGKPLRGNVVALVTGERNDEMLAKAFKGVMLVLSVILISSAFLPLRTPNPPRSLMLLGAGLVSMGSVSRRHFADE
jgi:hypothetical protein